MLGYGSCLIKFNISHSFCFRCGTKMNYGQYGWYYRNGNEKSPSWSGVEYLYKFFLKGTLMKICNAVYELVRYALERKLINEEGLEGMLPY